jgi:hypothetical protein
MIADDTNLPCYGKSSLDIEQKINTDLDNVHKWLILNKLTLNTEKTEDMITVSRQRLNQMFSNPEIVIRNQKIKREYRKQKIIGRNCRRTFFIFWMVRMQEIAFHGFKFQKFSWDYPSNK